MQFLNFKTRRQETLPKPTAVYSFQRMWCKLVQVEAVLWGELSRLLQQLAQVQHTLTILTLGRGRDESVTSKVHILNNYIPLTDTSPTKGRVIVLRLNQGFLGLTVKVLYTSKGLETSCFSLPPSSGCMSLPLALLLFATGESGPSSFSICLLRFNMDDISYREEIQILETGHAYWAYETVPTIPHPHSAQIRHPLLQFCRTTTKNLVCSGLDPINAHWY